MAAPSKNFATILDAAVDAESPVDTTLMTGVRDSLIHLREWLGGSFTAAVDHSHNGIDSAYISELASGSLRGNVLSDIGKRQLRAQANRTTISEATFDYSPAALVLLRQHWVSSPTLSTVVDSDGPWLRYTSTNASWSLTFSPTADYNIQRSWLPNFRCRFRTMSNITSGSRFWVGFNSNMGAYGSDTPTGYIAAFRRTFTGTTWDCVTSDNNFGAATVTVGPTIAASTVYNLAIYCIAGKVLFYINDVLVATHTTSLPTDTQQMQASITSTYAPASNQGFDLGGMYVDTY